jgi:hypothetical protein
MISLGFNSSVSWVCHQAGQNHEATLISHTLNYICITCLILCTPPAE